MQQPSRVAWNGLKAGAQKGTQVSELGVQQRTDPLPTREAKPPCLCVTLGSLV